MTLPSYYLKQRAQAAVDQVKGVERIYNPIPVMAPPQRVVNTGDAAEAGYLPLDARQAAAQPPREASRHRTVVRRVLVVGDQRDVVENWGLVLGQAGYRVRGTWIAPEALALAAKFQPDAAVLDFSRSGSAVACPLRQVPGLQGTLLITLAERATNQDRRRFGSAGFNYHLSKPVDAAVLLQLLTRSVEPR
jgi:CheY-like chemotaxis protein